MKRRLRKFCLKILMIIAFIFFLTQGLTKQEFKWFYKTDYSEYVEKYSELYDVDENLIFAIIKNESNFDKDAISKVGAKGLMQIMDSTAEDVAEELKLEKYDLLMPEDNIQIGVKYFSYLKDKYGDIPLALAAYNAGFGTVDAWISKGILSQNGNDYENIPYKETNLYVRKILRDYDVYQKNVN